MTIIKSVKIPKKIKWQQDLHLLAIEASKLSLVNTATRVGDCICVGFNPEDIRQYKPECTFIIRQVNLNLWYIFRKK